MRTVSSLMLVASVRVLSTGPTTKTGWIVSSLMPSRLAISHAAFSASTLLRGYGSDSSVLDSFQSAHEYKSPFTGGAAQTQPPVTHLQGGLKYGGMPLVSNPLLNAALAA